MLSLLKTGLCNRKVGVRYWVKRSLYKMNIILVFLIFVTCVQLICFIRGMLLVLFLRRRMTLVNLIG